MSAVSDIMEMLPEKFTLFGRKPVTAISSQTFEFHQYLQVKQKSVTHITHHYIK
jgi:hypothetical protein